jgi:hypothetical protein
MVAVMPQGQYSDTNTQVNTLTPTLPGVFSYKGMPCDMKLLKNVDL